MKSELKNPWKRLIKLAGPIVAVALLPSCTAQDLSPALGSSSLSQTEKARVIHRNALVLDGHADIVLPATSKTYLAKDGLSKVAPSKLKVGEVDAVIMSVAVGPGPRTPQGDNDARLEADAKLAAVNALAKASNSIVIATSAVDVRSAQKSGKTALILGFQNARSLQHDVSAIDVFYNEGVRIFGLNHMGHNDFSDSSRPIYIAATRSYEVTEEHGGLSPLGVAAVKRVNALGGVIDVSQMSKAATLQTLKLSQAPVIASHSNVRKLSNVTRNLSDEEIDAIGKNGGVINIAAFGAYLVDLSDPKLLAAIKKVRLDAGLPETYSYPYELYWELKDPKEKLAFLMAMRSVIGPGSVERMIDHIDYIVKRIGIDHVGIGNDFNHGGGVAGFADASEALNMTTALLKRGYSENQIRKIWGENFLRVFDEAQKKTGSSTE